MPGVKAQGGMAKRALADSRLNVGEDQEPALQPSGRTPGDVSRFRDVLIGVLPICMPLRFFFGLVPSRMRDPVTDLKAFCCPTGSRRGFHDMPRAQLCLTAIKSSL